MKHAEHTKQEQCELDIKSDHNPSCDTLALPQQIKFQIEQRSCSFSYAATVSANRRAENDIEGN